MTSRYSLHKKEKAAELIKYSSQSAKVEAIYVIFTNLDGENGEIMAKDAVNNLDKTSRELCFGLKHFTIVSKNHNIANSACMSRECVGLPVQSIELKELKPYDDTEINENGDNAPNNGLNWNEAIYLVEKAIFSKCATYVVPLLAKHYFRDNIWEIPGAKTLSKADDEMTLENIGIDNRLARELVKQAREKYNISIVDENLRNLTVEKLKNLPYDWTDVCLEENVASLSNYSVFVDTDEVSANAEMVIMPTLVNFSEMRSDEFDSNLTYVCIVPGVEGHHAKFATLSERLKLPTIVLQLGLDNVDETLEETAQRLVNTMINKMKLKKHFYLVGYEFGVMLVLKMAAILEDKHGLTGTVYCLGGTPDDIHRALEIHLKNTNLDQFQNTLIEDTYEHLTGSISLKLKVFLSTGNCWEDKITGYLKELHGRVKFSDQYLRDMIEVVYARVQIMLNYSEDLHPLRSKVILMRAMYLEPINFENIRSLSLQPVAIHELRATLPLAMQDLRCSAIVNKYLEKQILEDYRNSNHCETYLLNENMYLQLKTG